MEAGPASHIDFLFLGAVFRLFGFMMYRNKVNILHLTTTNSQLGKSSILIRKRLNPGSEIENIHLHLLFFLPRYIHSRTLVKFECCPCLRFGLEAWFDTILSVLLSI